MSDVKTDVSSSSTVLEEAVEGNLCNVEKLCLKDTIVYYEQLLAQDGLIAQKSSSVITKESKLLAEDIYQYTLQNLTEKKFITDEELITSDEINYDAFEEVEEYDSSKDYEPEEKSRKSRTIFHWITK